MKKRLALSFVMATIILSGFDGNADVAGMTFYDWGNVTSYYFDPSPRAGEVCSVHWGAVSYLGPELEIVLSNHVYECHGSDHTKVFYGCGVGRFMTEYSGSVVTYNRWVESVKVVNEEPTVWFERDYKITNIVDSAFAGCESLKRSVFPAEIGDIPYMGFCGCLALTYCEGGFTNIAERAFADCWSLNASGLNFLSDVRSIGKMAFMRCKAMTSFVLGKHLQSVGEDAFLGATNIENVVAEGFPPNGLPESRLMQKYPMVTYPEVYETEWQTALAECSTNLIVTISDGTNAFVQTGASKTIILSCDVDQANIYYTLDGSEPTTNSALYTTKFKVKPEGKMTIKASAIIDRWPYHSVQSITLAPGKCEVPSASMADGEKFYFRNQNVSLATATENGVIRYTLDGSEPTEASAVYVSPIVISETTTIKAKAFRDDYFDSDVMTVTLVRDWYRVATPNIVAYYGAIQEGNEKMTFEGSHVSVVITNATEDVEIHYTVDGTEPTEESPTYVAPFKVFENTTVKAMAIKDDWKSSVVAMTVLVKQHGIGDVMKDADATFVNDVDYPWTEDSTVFYSGVSSMRSGTAPDRAKSTLTTEVTGAGRVLFRWKADCESDTYDHEFDHGEFRVDNMESAVRIDGQTGWRSEDVRVEGDGAHTLAWIYQKDDGDEKGYSGGKIWVDNFVWIPDDGSKVTYRSENEVPYNWLYHYGLLKERVPEVAVETETGKRDSSGKALTPEADYVAGTDPTNLTSVFTAYIDMSTGSPDISWDPDLNEKGTKSLRDYKVWGKEALDGGAAWEWPTNALHRFFKVTVEMP